MSKRDYWLAVLGLLSAAVVMVMAILAYLLFTLPASSPQITPTPSPVALSLPTAPLPAATPGPRWPGKILFRPEKPISGYSNCEVYGFKGRVLADTGEPLADVQIVVWDEVTGLAALATSAANGAYLIQIHDKPAARKLWVQIYENDVPVSEPVLTQTQLDCQHGFQVYQVNWRRLPEERGN
ncbi:MAG: carboxypeptidase-like regulatory domain-containing protein [Chloroflexota bacterium]